MTFAAKRLIVENVVRNIEGLSDPPGIVNILPGAATAFAPRSGPVIVKLKRDADDVMARGLQIAAATELSTPPDIATTTRFPDAAATAGPPIAMRSADDVSN